MTHSMSIHYASREDLLRLAMGFHPTRDNNFEGGTELERIVEVIIERGDETAMDALIKASEIHKLTTLNCLVIAGKLRILRRHDISMDHGNGMCYFAVRYNHLHILRWLESRGHWMGHLLSTAARYGHLRLVQWILTRNECKMEQEEETQPRSFDGCPITSALYGRHFHILDYLEEYGLQWTQEHHDLNRRFEEMWVPRKD